MSKQAEADLILKLYELRREPKMREARDWFFRDFHPDSMADILAAMSGPHSATLRMVISYWEMAATLVAYGAIDSNLFNDTNGEHYIVYAKLKPILEEYRAAFGPGVLKNVQKLIVEAPDGKERLAELEQRLQAMRAQMAKS